MRRLRNQSFYPGIWSPLSQPVGPVEVDWGHALSVGLIGAYIPTMFERWVNNGYTAPPLLRDLSRIGNSLVSADTSNSVNITTGPLGVQATATGLTGSGAGGYRVAPVAAQQPTNAASLFCRAYIAAGGNLSGYPMLIGCSYAATSTSPYDCWNVRRPGTSSTALSFSWNVGGTNGNLTLNSAIATGGIYNIGFSLSCNGVANGSAAYLNGVPTTTTASSGSISYGSPAQLFFNGCDGSGASTGAGLSVGYLWNRTLSASEQAILNAEPYVLLQPVARRRFVGAASAAAGAQARAWVMA